MQLEEKYSKIEHQNRLLLSRMSDIMTRPIGGGAAAGAGGVDNVCHAWEFGRSMNTRNRKSEEERIANCNEVSRSFILTQHKFPTFFLTLFLHAFLYPVA